MTAIESDVLAPIPVPSRDRPARSTDPSRCSCAARAIVWISSPSLGAARLGTSFAS